ncbi:hypothetical protein [Nocardia sp. NPDC004415]
MTGQNPPPSGDKPPSDPTVQWWEQPRADAPNPGQADPTVLRGGIGDHGGYTPPPQPYPGGTGDHGAYAPPVNPYASAPQPQPQFVAPYQAPQQQWGAPPPRPPSSGNSTVWWIVGGSVLLVGVLVIGLVVFAANKAEDAFGPDSSKWAGDYEFIEGKNACDLVDLTVLDQWSSTRQTTTHTEHAPYEYIGGGSYNCSAQNKSSGRDANGANLNLQVEFKTESETESDYSRWKSSDTRTTGKGYENGAVSGLGSEAYYAYEEQTYSSIPDDYTYVVAAHDSNISVKVEIEVESMRSVDKSTLAAAAEAQVRKVLAALKK